MIAFPAHGLGAIKCMAECDGLCHSHCVEVADRCTAALSAHELDAIHAAHFRTHVCDVCARTPKHTVDCMNDQAQ
jgi:hypothetical protein